MIYLLLAILSSTGVSLVMRLSSKYADENKKLSMLSVNYLICTLLACYYSGFQNAFIKADGSKISMGLGLINGLLYLLGFIFLQLNVERNGVALSSTFSRLGVLVPTTVSILIFHETPSFLQAAGLLIALAAIIGISTEKQRGEKGAATFKAGLIMMLLANGTADAMSKVYDELGNAALSDQFLVFTFAAAFVFSMIYMLYRRQTFGKMELLFGVLIAIPNYYSARFLLAAISSIPAVAAYPTYSVGTIIVGILMGILFFRESLSKRQIIAIGGIMAALICLNI